MLHLTTVWSGEEGGVFLLELVFSSHVKSGTLLVLLNVTNGIRLMAQSAWTLFQVGHMECIIELYSALQEVELVSLELVLEQGFELLITSSNKTVDCTSSSISREFEWFLWLARLFVDWLCGTLIQISTNAVLK
ncbi:hypothetical protein Tco_0384990 [Tanacetum coccineum]